MEELLNKLKDETCRTSCSYLQIYYSSKRCKWVVRLSYDQKVEDRELVTALKQALRKLKSERKILKCKNKHKYTL